jgi:hypothetical protein
MNEINQHRRHILLGYLTGSISIGVVFFVLFVYPHLLWFGVVVVFLVLGWFRGFLKRSRQEYLLKIFVTLAPKGMMINDYQETVAKPEWFDDNTISGAVSYENWMSGKIGEQSFEVVDVKCEALLVGGRGSKQLISQQRQLWYNQQLYQLEIATGYYLDLFVKFNVNDQQRFTNQLQQLIDVVNKK